MFFSSQKLHADYKLGVYLEEMCFENGYGFAFTKERSSIACKPYGVVINNFANPSLARDIGVKQMDVIVNFDGKDTKTMRAFVNQFSSTKNKINHEMIIHRWNNSLGKMEQFKVNFKVPGKSENIEKKTVKNHESNKSSKLTNQKIEEELFVSIDNLVIREKPNGIKIGNLYKNNKVVIYDKNDDKSWTLVKDINTNLIGWVSSKYLSKNKITRDDKDQNLEITKNDSKEDKNNKTETMKEKPKEKLFVNSHLATINHNTKKITFNEESTPWRVFIPKSKDDISYTYKDIGDNKKELIINGEGTFKFKNGEVYEGQIKDSKMDGIGRYTFGKYYEYKYTGNFVDGLKSGLGKIEFNANVYNKSLSNNIDTIKAQKIEELRITNLEKGKILSQIEQLEIKKISSQTKNKENLSLCENINIKIADDFDFDISNWDNNNCSQFKLLKCERLCYHKSDSFDSCNNCHQQVGVLPKEDTSIDSQLKTLKNELSKKENLINELQNSQANLNFKEKESFSIKSKWNNDKMDISKPVKISFPVANKSYNGFINDDFEPNGIGELTLGNTNTVIKGEWVNGLINKQASIKFSNNNIVSGPLNFHYSERLLNSKNFNVEKFNIINQDYKINFSNGDVYTGTVKFKDKNLNTSSPTQKKQISIIDNNSFLLHGFGKINYESGDLYEGDWINNMKSGFGRYQNKDGDIYNGQWKDDKKHNQGTMIYINGEKYEGEWRENKRHGDGTLFNTENTILQKGLYTDDNFLEGYNDNKYVYANGNIYEGELDNYSPHGYGIVLDKEGKLISKGKFQKNKKTGLFIEFRANKYELIDYDYMDGKEIESLTNIQILEICRTELKKNEDCYGKTEINFLNSPLFKGTFYGLFENNKPNEGFIKFKKNEKNFDTFLGSIVEDEFGNKKYEGKISVLNDNLIFEGIFSIILPDKSKNYEFIGSVYDLENGNETKYEIVNRTNIQKSFINNYSILNNGDIKFKKDINAYDIKYKKCRNKFYEINHFYKNFKITDFKSVEELKKKLNYYDGIRKQLWDDKKSELIWDASLKISGLIDCYEKSYDQIIDIDKSFRLKAGQYKIRLIAKDFILLQNGNVVKRFNDELTLLEQEFKNISKDYKNNLNKESFKNYNHILLDYAFSEFPQEIIDYKINLSIVDKFYMTIDELNKEIVFVENDESLINKKRKENIKILKSKIKDSKKEIKKINKELKKNYKWNDFEIITERLKRSVFDLSQFAYDEPRKELKDPKYNDNIYIMISEWEEEYEKYTLEQEKIAQEKRRKQEEKDLIEYCYSIIHNCPSNPSFGTTCYRCNSEIKLDFLNKLAGD